MLGVGRQPSAAERRADATAPAPDAPTVPAEADAATVPADEDRTPAVASTERDAWAVLASADGLGPVGFAALMRRFGSATRVLEVARATSGAGEIACVPLHEPLGGIGGRSLIGTDVATAISEAAANPTAVIDQIVSLGLRVLTLEDPEYPRRLLGLELPPHVLFVRGSVAALGTPHAIAIVGTRRPTESGRWMAGRIASAVAGAGAVVVSGLAVGIDGAAHAAAVAARSPTVAVLGGGHAHLFPAAHRRLADAIVAEGGAIVSELSPDCAPMPGTFPRRNRLVSGLTDATVVVEAGLQSGALITAHWALEQGRDCFLVPGAMDAATSAGCLAFLRAYPGQARVVAGVRELIEDLGLAETASGRSNDRAGPELRDLGTVERGIFEALLAGAVTVDDLVARTSLAVATVLGGLTLLEMRALVTGAYGRYRPAYGVADRSRRSHPRGGIPSGRAQ
jgi:DNA processing protein